MKMSLTADDLRDYVKRQCQFLFPDNSKCYASQMNKSAYEEALFRTEECFRHITLRGWADKGEAVFSHLHSDQYSQFLYFYANSLWKTAENEDFARRLMILNRSISGTFVSYKCPLPPHFLFGHAVGTVVGNADYGDFVVFFQNVTVNTGDDLGGTLVPKIGNGLFMAAGSSIIGKEPIGNGCSLGANVCLYNTPLKDNSVVALQDGNQIIRTRKSAECKAQSFFDIPVC